MKRKSIEYIWKGVTYIVEVGNSCFSCCAEVYIKEVIHPERKFFRTRTVDTRTFFIDEYATIEEGCKECLKKYLHEHAVEESRIQKWVKFQQEF